MLHNGVRTWLIFEALFIPNIQSDDSKTQTEHTVNPSKYPPRTNAEPKLLYMQIH